MRRVVAAVAQLGAAIVLILSVGASAAAPDCAAPPKTLGKFTATPEPRGLPSTTFLLDDNQDRGFEPFKGQGLVLNFWATWCAPCVEEMPALDRLARKQNEMNLRVLPLSADREGAAIVRKFYDKNGLAALPVAIDPKSRVARALAIPGLPTTVLFDAGGREVGRVVGVADWDAPQTLDFLRRCLAPAG